MKVAWFSGFPVFGGPQNYIAELWEPLSRLGVEVTAVVPAGSPAQGRLEAAGVRTVGTPVHRLRESRDWRPHYEFVRHLMPDARAIGAILREERSDVLVQGNLIPPHGALGATLARVPVVWQVVDTRVPAPARRVAMQLVRGIADATMFTGAAVRDLHGGQQLPCAAEVFFPFVDTDRFAPSLEHRRAVRDEEGIPAGAPVVGMVANVNPMKGWEYFVRAAGLLARGRPDVHLLMVGAHYDEHRGYLESLEDEMARTGLPRERFHVTGERSDVHRLLAAMDVHLVTSVPRSEGAPTTIAEGMAVGVPMVAADVAAISEMVEDGVTGYLVEALAPEQVAAAAGRVLDDVELRQRFAAAARERALRRYDLEAAARQHARVFRDAIVARRERVPRLARLAGGRPASGRRPTVVLLSHAFLDLEVRKMLGALEPHMRAVAVTLDRYPVPPAVGAEFFRPTRAPTDAQWRDVFVGFRPLYRPGSPAVSQYALISLSLGFRQLRPDVIHTEYPPWSPIFWQALLARRLFAPHACVVLFAKKNTYRRHGGVAQRFKDGLMAAGLRRTDLVMAVSQKAADLYVDLGFPRERVVVTTAAGVDGDLFRPAEPPRTPGPEVVVGYTGRIEVEKGVSDLIEAVGIVRDRDGLDVRLRILGGGSLRAELAARADGWLEILPGVPTTEVPSFLHGLDLYVLPSRILPDHEEHDAHALLEAQAVGLPVIGTRSGIIPELIEDGSGVLVPAEDPGALADAIAALAADPAHRADVARRGFEKARAEYLLGTVAREHAAIYASLLR